MDQAHDSALPDAVAAAIEGRASITQQAVLAAFISARHPQVAARARGSRIRARAQQLQARDPGRSRSDIADQLAGEFYQDIRSIYRALALADKTAPIPSVTPPAAKVKMAP